jgi:hypothetical protein
MGETHIHFYELYQEINVCCITVPFQNLNFYEI